MAIDIISNNGGGTPANWFLVGDSWGSGLKPYWPKGPNNENYTDVQGGIEISASNRYGEGAVSRVQKAVASGKTHIFVWIGLNSFGRSERDWETELTELKNAGGNSILYINTQVHVFNNDFCNKNYNNKMESYNNIVKRVFTNVIELGIDDYSKYTRASTNGGHDSEFHLNSEGYKKLAEDILTKLNSASGGATSNTGVGGGGVGLYLGDMRDWQNRVYVRNIMVDESLGKNKVYHLSSEGILHNVVTQQHNRKQQFQALASLIAQSGKEMGRRIILSTDEPYEVQLLKGDQQSRINV